MPTVIPFPRTAQTPADVRFLAAVLNATEPELFALALVGETAEERAARRAAAADIVDDLAAEFTSALANDDWSEGSAA